MPALTIAGISKQQLLAVWSTNAGIGFTPAQLIEARISIAEMQSNNITLSQIYNSGVSITYLLGTGLTISQLYTGGIPGYLLFNEVCNTPLSVGTSPDPVIRLLSTNLSPTNTQVVLEGRSIGSIVWRISGFSNAVISFVDRDIVNSSKMLGRATGVLKRKDSSLFVSTLSLPFDYVFSNLTVTLTSSQLVPTRIQLCPGR